MYDWRKMTPKQRGEVLQLRRKSCVPWHSPPHYNEEGTYHYHLSGACFEHRPVIGVSPERMAWFESELKTVLSDGENQLVVWCILPNHWHALVSTPDLKTIISAVGKLNGRTSCLWNKEEDLQGRKCWHRCADRRIRSDEHRYSVINYIHHNPVKHGYVDQWQGWPFSSAAEYINDAGYDTVLKQWRKYPVLDMGKGWDD